MNTYLKYFVYEIIAGKISTVAHDIHGELIETTEIHGKEMIIFTIYKREMSIFT